MVGRLQERALVRLVPVWEAQLDPVSYNEDQNSENYGAVSMYSFTEIPVQQQRSGQPVASSTFTLIALSFWLKARMTGGLIPASRCWKRGSTSCWTSKKFRAVRRKGS